MTLVAELAYPTAIVLLLAILVRQRITLGRSRREIEQIMLQLEGANNRLEQVKGQVALLSHSDPVTGLLARQVVVERFHLTLAMSRRQRYVFGIVVMQLGGFADLVARHGSEIGDRLLQALGTRLRAATRDTDTVGRIRDDEFAVLLPVLNEPEDVLVVTAKLRAAIEPEFVLPGVAENFCLAPYFGSATYPADGEDWSTILATADENIARSRVQVRV